MRLFDRTGRFPKLTPEGVLLPADARNVVASVDVLKARARLMSTGLEAELSVVVDVFFPTAGFMLAMSAVHPASAPPGPAGRWFVDHLKAGFGGVPPRALQR